jgi:hypothetical protein
LLSDKYIRKQASMPETYYRGCQYFKDGKVAHISVSNNIIYAEVAGSELYEVEIELEVSEDRLKTMFCSCPAFSNNDAACKHVIAVLKAAQGDLSNLAMGTSQYKQQKTHAEELLAFFRSNDEDAPVFSEEKTKIRLVPTYLFFIANNRRVSALELAIGIDKMYVIKNIKELLRTFENDDIILYGKNFRLIPAEMEFDAQSQVLYDLIKTAYSEEQQISSWSAHTGPPTNFPDTKRFYLTQTNLNKFLDLMDETQFAAKMQDEDVVVKVIKDVPPLLFSAVKTNRGIKLSLGVAAKSGPL